MFDLASLDIASQEVEKYGVHPDQFIEWYGPQDGRAVVAVHGGGLNGSGRLKYLRPAALALGEAGYRVALVEYRQAERNPEITFEDISTLTRLPSFADAIWFGHSFGAIFVIGALLDPETPVSRCVAAAPILDLRREVEESANFTENALAKWLGGSPYYIPDVYAKYDPAVLYARIGGANGFSARGYHLDLIHGSADMTVPVQHTKDAQSEPFNIAIVPGANHYDVIRPGHDAWLFLLGALG
ncbi:hypothetical protein RQN30_05035 [Arcanobacterium hippocoleae]